MMANEARWQDYDVRRLCVLERYLQEAAGHTYGHNLHYADCSNLVILLVYGSDGTVKEHGYQRT